ncbi:MAG: ATP-binding cassette domain-containing protein [Oscillospiraceae bacterium]|nr:ATP-binding cassette domain-containing protein [Oscillospiraceae bacterium]
MIIVKNLFKKIKNNLILNNINFEVKKSESVFIVGHSGAGKSTLLRCINLLEKFNSGEIFLENRSISEINIIRLRQKIGMIFQNFNLFPHMTVKQNLMLAPEKLGIKSKKDCEIQAMELLESVSLGEKINFYPAKLSGGEKQRVAIMRAVALNPKVLLIDEPTSALDPEKTSEISLILKKLNYENEITTITVTHDMNFAKSTADRVIFMQKGEINCDAPVGVFFKNFISFNKQ